MQNRWEQFLFELEQIFRFWLIGVLSLGLYRVVFIGSFWREVEIAPSIKSVFELFFMGFRFDSMVVGYFILFPFASLLLLAYWAKFNWVRRIRRFFECLFVVLTAAICVIAVNYYTEFSSTFDNNLLLGLFEEDLVSIFDMIYTYKNPVLNLLVFVLLLVVGWLVFNRFLRRFGLVRWLKDMKLLTGRATVVFVSVFLLLACLRGTFGLDSIKVRNSAVTPDLFLNMSVLNPYKALDVAYKDYKEANKLGAVNPFLNERVDKLWGKPSVEEYLQRKAKGAQINKPKQVFLIIMESYDAWSLLDKYRPFGVSDNLVRIADQGTTFMNFLPAYNATIYAYNALAGGIPYFGVNVSQLNKLSEEYACSIFENMEHLGYKTNFFYGGYLSWQKIDSFSEYLGCDRAYSATDIGKNLVNGWGVEDEDLFDFILEKVNPEEYTFNVVLTTSYHPPFNIDVYAKGYPYHTKDDIPVAVRDYLDEDVMSVLELGHRWYGDYAIGQFMNKAEQVYPEALYAFTGDHFARKFINHKPNLYEESAVPFILYGKGIPAQQLSTPGSHIDIAPTLVELIAPAGFEYHSFGSSMLDDSKPFGLGFNKLITPEYIYVEGADFKLDRMELASGKEEEVKQVPFYEGYSLTLALAWHYVAKGNKIDSLARTI